MDGVQSGKGPETHAVGGVTPESGDSGEGRACGEPDWDQAG